MNRVNVIVPVYGDKSSLSKCIQSLARYYSDVDWIDVYFVNDCGPEADEIEELIEKYIGAISNFYYHRNPENLGFVRNVNNATFNIVVDKKADILLFNSDAEVKSGAIETMRELLNSNKTIGAVNPRTNNATMFGGVSIAVPLDNSLCLKPEKSYRLFRRNTVNTPEYETIPVFSGFCVLIRRKIIDKIGLLDEAYDSGYYDDNDMAMRINAHGYQCVVSNRAFVVHFGSKSFSDHYRIHRSNVNQKIFIKRYPDYFDFINKYPHSLYTLQPKRTHPLKRTAHILERGLRYGNERGYRNAVKLASKKVIEKTLGKRQVANRKPQVQVWFHEITNTGAPLVMLDVINEWKKDKSFPDNIEYFYPIHTNINDEAMLNFISHDIYPVVKSNVDIEFVKGDVVVLNSALPDWVYEKVFANLQSGIIKHAYFYIHENADLYLVKHIGILLRNNKKLLDDKKITIYNPSQATVETWKNKCNIDSNIFVMSGRVKYDARMFKKRPIDDFDKINFVSAGSSVPRKGYMNTVHAFIAFYNAFYKNSPSTYRDFSFNIWGFSGDDYFYNDFIENEAKGLSDRIRLIPKTVSMDAVYDFYENNNFNITYSIDETYSMVTMENMSFGYPIIRSEVPGMSEQLKVGKNGWFVPTTDWWQLVQTIEEVLNKSKTSNEKLKAMSDESIKIAYKQYNRPYRFIEDYKNDIN